MPRFDVEFSLALNNKTGKFFALRDMIAGQRGRIRRLRFWRLTSTAPPSGLFARVLGRLMTWEVSARVRYPWIDGVFPRMRPALPVIFTDPLQVAFYQLTRDDVVVVHDVGPVSAPEFYVPEVEAIYTAIFTEIARVGPHLVFVSEASREAFGSRYGQVARSEAVIYNPVRLEASTGPQQSPLGVGRRFLLCVGAVGARKNQAGALRGFRLAGLAERGFEFVICGGPEPGYDQVVAEAARTPGARLIGYATEPELRWLYDHADGFVLISWLEGFGMPAAEAIFRGLLPVLSTEPALQEVAEESAIYVDASDDVSVANGLLQLADLRAAERQARLARARDHLLKFAPDRVAESWDLYLSSL